MREYEQRYTPARLLLRRAILIGLLVVFVALAQGTWHAYLKERETKAGRQRAEDELIHLKKRSSDLEGKVYRLKTDQGVEEELRAQFNVGHPGEQLIIVVNPEEENQEPIVSDDAPWWKRIFGR
jgi:cell division protein FtsB